MRWLVVATCILCAGPALAAQTSVAILPLQAKSGDATLVSKASRALEDAAEAHADVKAVTAKALRKRGKDTPESIVDKCAGAPVCLAAYGRSVETTQVLYGAATVNNRTVSINFVLVGSATATVIAETQLSIGAGEEMKQTFAAEIARVLGQEAAEMPALQAVMPAKRQAQQETAIPIETPSARPEKRSRALLYTGIVIAVVGAAGLGTAAYFGSESLRLGGSVNGDTPQVMTDQLERDANQDALIANLGFGIGGGMVALGATLIILDVIFELKTKATLSVSQNGAAASVVIPW